MEKENSQLTHTNYYNEDSPPLDSLIADPGFAYAGKRQGEFTLDDYYALPEEERFELIDGALIRMDSSSFSHQSAALEIAFQLKSFVNQRKGNCIPMISPLDVQLDCDDRTMVKPDVLVICDRSKIQDRRIYGAPDFLAEILSPSTSAIDKVVKLRKYRQAGVKEYWIVDLRRKNVLVYEFAQRDAPAIYGMDSPVPVGIFGGDCQIDFKAMSSLLDELLGEAQE